MAISALGAGVASRGRGRLMAIEATAHARQLIACREFQILDRAVALSATDVARHVQRVIEAQVRFRQRERRHTIARVASVAQVAKATLADWLLGLCAHAAEIAVIAAVAAVTARAL